METKKLVIIEITFKNRKVKTIINFNCSGLKGVF